MSFITEEQTIEKIIENFDFEKVQKIMKHLDWQYWDSEETPSIERLTETVISNLKICCNTLNKKRKKRAVCCAGGFVATARKYKDGELCLELSFQIDSFNWSNKDTCY